MRILDQCAGLPIRDFVAGEVLLAEGTRTGRLFFLVDGLVEIVKGDLQVNIVADPGAIFGEVSALLGIPHMATVRALGTCRAHVAEDAAVFLRDHPGLAYEIARLLALRLHGVTNYLADLKRQFNDQASHLGIVDEVLETLLHQQDERFDGGSDRDPNRAI